VTDYDAGIAGDPDATPVTQAEVFACFDANIARVRALLLETVSRIGETVVAS
jgi:purine nucleoside phosphorylase